ncbi:MAG: multicopper oxidase domain-containing protein [Pirellulaceae bacterium]|nr:multicopper oxidase domain-containing protein [Pirellulaceae bacterium]
MIHLLANSSRILVFVLATYLGITSTVGQSLEGDRKTKKSKVEATSFEGKWSYRSFRSDPDLSVPANDLLFGSGTLEITVSATGQVTGTLGGTGWQLNLLGTATNGSPSTIRFQGKGIIGGEEWRYDYLGYQVPEGPNGVDQRPAIVGSIVRAIPHSGGTSTAGYVAQWIAVKGDLESHLDSQSMQLEDSGEKRLRAKYKNDLLKMYLNEYGEMVDRRKSEAILGSSTIPAIKSSLNPETISSVNGRLDATLRVRYANLSIGNDTVRLRVYNDKLAGPVLRANAGDTLYITLINELPVVPTAGHGNGHHDWNTTNLHFHGLHVSPNGVPGAQSDNVFVSLKPLPTSDSNYPATENYEVTIPANHVAGTFWYHAHRHGSVAGQVSSGLAGALIIERKVIQGQADKLNLDSIPEIAAAVEEILLLQQIPYIWSNTSQVGTVETANAAAMFGPGAWKNDFKRYITVNGEKIPTIKVAPGEIRRLRFVHTGQREPIALTVQPATASGTSDGRLTMHEIAVDGLPTGKLASRKRLELHPGYRSDVLLEIPATASGVYYLTDENAPAGVGERGATEPLKWVAKIEVTGQIVSDDLPSPTAISGVGLDDLPANQANPLPQYAFYGIFLPDLKFFISKRNLATTDESVSLTNPDDRDFNELNSAREVHLDTIDRWFIGSRNGTATGGKPGITHPFHIHTNPFQIVRIKTFQGTDVTEQELGTGYKSLWRDTLAMKQGLTYELLTKYEDFTGSFVNHCHILDHEDNGMMEKVTIIDPSNPSSPVPLSATQPLAQWKGKTAKPSVTFFVKGSFCPHCMEQLKEMAETLADKGLDVSVVAASTLDDLTNFPKVPFELIADPQLKLFKKFGAYRNGEARHAVVVRSAKGEELMLQISDFPLMDASSILTAIAEQ